MRCRKFTNGCLLQCTFAGVMRTLVVMLLLNSLALFVTASAQDTLHDSTSRTRQTITTRPDTTARPVPARADSIARQTDTSHMAVLLAGQKPFEYLPASYRAIVLSSPFYKPLAAPLKLGTSERNPTGKDALFYLLAGLLLFFALVKLIFDKYVSNMLGLVFRGSLRQKQIREQLLQSPLPSLFLNIFFVLVTGLYAFFLVERLDAGNATGFWWLLLYCVLGIAGIYLVKFVVLKATGWIFNMREAADTYIFIVFLVNKLMAIFLLPLLIMIAFSKGSWAAPLFTLSYVLVGAFFVYRYIASFAPVRREVKVSQFHFFVYICAFEIIPLLLIYKVLLSFL